MDSQINSGNVDEAEEKLFSESNSTGGPKIEIQYFTDPKNGDTKVDISEVRQVFVGMNKDELMKFANDPFWVRMRWCLFILFWILWFGMLGGAVAIILLAPKCTAPAVNDEWYQVKPIYHINVKDFHHDEIKNLKSVESKLDYFKELGVGALLLDPIMPHADGTDDIVDFTSISPDYGTFDDLRKLINTAKEKGLHILMKIIPNYSSDKHEWFKKSVENEKPYRDYYVWTNPAYDKDGNRQPKTNWINVYGDSIWTWNDLRKQYYLHQFNSSQPDLNFYNNDVKNYFKEMLRFWLDRGLSGLYLEKVEFLAEDDKFSQESSSGVVGTIHDEYEFQNHKYTAHLQESLDILSRWAEVFTNYSAVYAISDVTALKEADIIYRPISIKRSGKPKELEETLLRRLNMSSQAWGLSCNDCPPKMKIGLQAALLMLPGAAIIPSGFGLSNSELNLFEHSSNKTQEGTQSTNLFIGKPQPYFDMFKKIIEERHSLTLRDGITNLKLLNSSVLAFTRTKTGSPSYLVAFNAKETEEKVKIEEFFKGIPELTPELFEKNMLAKSDEGIMIDPSTSKVVMPGYSVFFFRFISGGGE